MLIVIRSINWSVGLVKLVRQSVCWLVGWIVIPFSLVANWPIYEGLLQKWYRSQNWFPSQYWYADSIWKGARKFLEGGHPYTIHWSDLLGSRAGHFLKRVIQLTSLELTGHSIGHFVLLPMLTRGALLMVQKTRHLATVQRSQSKSPLLFYCPDTASFSNLNKSPCFF